MDNEKITQNQSSDKKQLPENNLPIRMDERDTMFSRMALEVGSKEYDYYYTKHPDKKEYDDAIRLKPHLCSEGTATYHPVLSKIADSNFQFLTHLRPLCEGDVADERIPMPPSEAAHLLGQMALRYGAVKVGCVKLEDRFIYSHRGRHKESYGDEISMKHTYAIVFAVEMDKAMINRAPQVASVIETSKAYVDAAMIGMQLAYYIRSLGYDARNHMDGNYLVHCVSLAYAAGLGEIGRNGVLTTLEYGSRVRLGVVTTELELFPDEPMDFGLKNLCLECRKCIRTCPGKAISVEQDSAKWHIEQEKCYDRWRSLGTDCGICISVCPLSQDSPINSNLMCQGTNSKGDVFFNQEDISKIISNFETNYGIRPYNKEPWPERQEKKNEST